MSVGPLEGTRILEVEGIGPGPFAAMMLADLCANVIVAHRPRNARVPGIKDRPITDRGKRSITLDLKDVADRDVFLGLMATADGVIEGFRPGVMERLGLGPTECHSLNPRLVYGRMTGWGQTGPMACQAGHDLNYLALAGALAVASPEQDRPSVPPTLVGDIGGGALYLVTGMLAGLLAAGRTGQGTVVDAAICDGAAHMQNLLMSIDVGHGSAASPDNPLVGAHWSRTYRCADGGYISVQCLEPKFYMIFLEKMGLAEDVSFTDHQFDQTAWSYLSDRLTGLFAKHDLAYWDAHFAGSDACVAAVLTPDEAMQHPHNSVRGTWHKTKDGLQASPAPRFSTYVPVQPAQIMDRNAHGAQIRKALLSGDGWRRD